MINTEKIKTSTNLEKIKTGVAGLDDVLAGGLPRNHLYLLQGKPGTGKTTLAMQFLLEGAANNEKSIYITFSETRAELDAVARSHGWDMSGVSILDLTNISATIGAAAQNTLFHPSEYELNKVTTLLLEKINEANAARIVFDSISELRLMADSSLRYRRQMLLFKEFFIGRGSTVLFLDDMTADEGDLHVQSIVHGVFLLEKLRASYGIERRQFHVSKLRGVAFKGGNHDYEIKHGGIQIFPRLVAADCASKAYKPETLSSGVAELDSLMGGGLDRGTSNLILGPPGSGKSILTVRFALTAAQNGKKVAMYNFDENLVNLIRRSDTLGMPIQHYIDTGFITLQKIDPAELTPGRFTSIVRQAVDHGVDMVIIDSLNGYLHAMPEQQFLILQLHELMSYLNSCGIVTLVVLSQAGIMGSMQAPLDLTYLADSVILTRFFEAFGEVKKAISVIKKRTGAHEESLREFKVGNGGIVVGSILKDFSCMFSGIPQYIGYQDRIMNEAHE